MSENFKRVMAGLNEAVDMASSAKPGDVEDSRDEHSILPQPSIAHQSVGEVIERLTRYADSINGRNDLKCGLLMCADAMQESAAALQASEAARTLAEARVGELEGRRTTAWLIEWPATKHDPLRYWHATEPRMMDPHDATWFARKEDAEAMMKRDRLFGGARAVEHIFGLTLTETQLTASKSRVGELEEAVKTATADADMYARAWQRELSDYVVGKRHHIDAMVVSTRRLVSEVRRQRAWASIIEQWKADAATARTLGLPDPDLFALLSPSQGGEGQ